ncbi:HAD family phosphatase [Candidatus Woesearchaeota archaeon]|nr:HAD family phosphatase [Candidatus Woesearchaeota archaeon]
MLRAIIFDMDGVLINTPKFVWATHNKLLAKFDKHISDSKISQYLGRSLKDQINLFEKNFNITIDKEDYMSQFEVEMQHNLEHIEKDNSLSQLIKNLKKKFKLAVATSSSKSRAGHILKHLGINNDFEVIITSDDVKKHKPFPDLFLEAARQLKLKPEECLVVEDAANGVEAAKNANMKVVALKTEFQSEEELKNADLIVHKLPEIRVKKLELS